MSAPADPLFGSHPRRFAENLYVYPVLSRRAGGISIGVNLNRDRFCNFNCIYCQVERDEKSSQSKVEIEAEIDAEIEVDLSQLKEELDWTIDQCTSGELFRAERFNRAPEALRRLNDIAMSGDGEPTAAPNFPEATAVCAEARRRHRLDEVKLVLITNASLLHRPRVREGLEILDRNNGEIWAKLDAGTEAYYAQVARSAVPWRRILENLQAAARVRPIVIQTLFMRIRGRQPPPEEIAAYVERLREIVAGGGNIKLVQIHTIARPPAESYAAPLANAEVDAIADCLRRETGLPVAAYYGGHS
ncbi:MAG: radical SAM protein [Pirellulales bacterium]|nr:radical SAM protein [Pirellulales bacterium]